MTENLKIVVVGDGLVGKTCLLIGYKDREYLDAPYVLTVFDNWNLPISLDGQDYDVGVWDTAGQEEYEKLRLLAYPNTTCFLMCFSISNKTSYENISTKWIPELKQHAPKAAIILVGTKSDLRKVDDPTLLLTNFEDGNKLRRKVQACGYFECSAINLTGLDEIFIAAVRASTKKSKKICQFL